MAKRRRRERKPPDLVSLAAAAFSLVSIVLFCAAVLRSAENDGQIGRTAAGGGFVLLLLSVAALAEGIRRAPGDERALWSRAAGVIAPAVSFVLWLIVYLRGLMFL